MFLAGIFHTSLFSFIDEFRVENFQCQTHLPQISCWIFFWGHIVRVFFNDLPVEIDWTSFERDGPFGVQALSSSVSCESFELCSRGLRIFSNLSEMFMLLYYVNTTHKSVRGKQEIVRRWELAEISCWLKYEFYLLRCLSRSRAIPSIPMLYWNTKINVINWKTNHHQCNQ